MKGFTLNAVQLIGFIIAFLAMYMGLPGVVLTPETLKIFSIVIAVGTITLKTPWFVSQSWKGGNWTAYVWVINIAYLAIAVFTNLVDSSLIAAGWGMGIVSTLNLFVLYFGNNSAAKTA